MNDEDIDDMFLERAARMFPRIEGMPCVCIDTTSENSYFAYKIENLRVNERVIEGNCFWKEPSECRPSEMTDGIAIGCDLLDCGGDWIFDMYFQWFYVFDPSWVSRSQIGDDAWVKPFVETTKRNR